MPQETARIQGLLKAGLPLSDADFDACLPEAQRRVSYRYWTSVAIVARVVRWLSGAGAERVLDVGSGVGKFCVVGALASPMAFTGIEHRAHLVELAKGLAERFDVAPRATFLTGGLDGVDFRDFDALYFYNPFGENHFTAFDHLDSTVEVNRRRFDRDVAMAESLLGRVPMGTRIATFNSFGGRIPDTFDLEQATLADHSLLRFWRKARRRSGGGYWLELEETTVLREPGGCELTLAPALDEPGGT